MSRAVMQDLPEGARFHEPHGQTVYRITTPASAHEYGWVEVWNESMTDAEVARRLVTAGAVERGCDPREGSFSFSHPVEVEVLP